MGSAGFLLGSAKYLQKNHSTELMRKDVAEHYNKTMFNGFDTDPTMLRIGAMNMLLHGVEEPKIERQDSLSDDNKLSLKSTDSSFVISLSLIVFSQLTKEIEIKDAINNFIFVFIFLPLNKKILL
jgi:type I restriction-modification system DNA methylase subunit